MDEVDEVDEVDEEMKPADNTTELETSRLQSKVVKNVGMQRPGPSRVCLKREWNDDNKPE